MKLKKDNVILRVTNPDEIEALKKQGFKEVIKKKANEDKTNKGRVDLED